MNPISISKFDMSKVITHIPVMQDSAVEALNIKANGIYVDCTFGRGGHSKEIISKLSNEGKLVIVDKDKEAIDCAKELFGNDSRVFIHQGSFADLSLFLEVHGFNSRVDGILVDLGVSSNQLDDASRGFSFSKDGPLDMRMNQQDGIKASQWLNSVSLEELNFVIKKYGEHPKANLIAQEIIKQREIKPFSTTSELSDLLAKKFNNPREKKHPATLVFQAIRIEINNELEDLNILLLQIPEVLKKHGRFVALSFHSLEDKRVKRFIENAANPNAWQDKYDMNVVLKKPIMKKIAKQKADLLQIRNNPRSRSVVMRVAEKI